MAVAHDNEAGAAFRFKPALALFQAQQARGARRHQKVEQRGRNAQGLVEKADVVEQIACRGERRVGSERYVGERLDLPEGQGLAEREEIGNRAPDDAHVEPAHGFPLRWRQPDGVHQAHARNREGRSAGQIVEFPAGSGVCAFGKVDEEGPVRSGVSFKRRATSWGSLMEWAQPYSAGT